MPHDPLAGVRQATLEAAQVNHEVRILGIPEAEIRSAIWQAATAMEISMNVRDLIERYQGRQRPHYQDVSPGAGTGAADAGADVGEGMP
jgi:hypothetical protein